MKTTLELPDTLVAEAMKLTKIQTKTEVITVALENLIQKETMQGLKKCCGSVQFHQDTLKEQLAQYRALIEDETDSTALMANTSAFIQQSLTGLNWAGFYVLKGNELVLGPFQGKIACYRIPMGKGVCGHCANTKQSIIVPDVHTFPGHIACDCASNSELVVPVMKNGNLFGVIDLDSFNYNNFTDEDRLFIEAIAALFAEKLHDIPD